ncbi:MAG TPA: hypothetical protein VFW47_01915 [Phenylobacterium sp.]|nr:hypothetical protein [Phenylobacterium sp.]
MRIAFVLALAALSPTVAPAQGLPAAWSVETPKDAPATLVYGAPGAPVLGFACVRRTGQVTTRLLIARKLADHRVGEVWVDAAGVAAPWPASVAFASGVASSTLRGQAEAGELPDVTAVSTEISTAAPVIKAFAKTGALTLTSLSETVSPAPARPGMVRKFLGACK